MKKQSAFKAIILALLVLGMWQSPHLQPIKDGLPQLTDKYVITGATVITSPGNSIENATILIENGVIRAVNSNVRIPQGYFKIKADSMYVYAGFIDALGHTGIKEEKPVPRSERPRVDNPGDPPRNIAGIQPERHAEDLINASEGSVKAMRELGYTIANVVPEGRMLPGAGAVILLSGDAADEMLLKSNSGMYGQLRGASGAYPGTVIGVMAKYRELFRNAQNAEIHQKAFTGNNGVSRPDYDESVRALIPVTNKSMAMYFKASDLMSVHRVLALQKELGFKLVLADVKQAWGLEDRFKSQNIPILLSLDLPEDKSDKKKDKKGKDDKKDEDDEDKGAEDEETKDDAENDAEDETKVDEDDVRNIETEKEKEALEKRRMDSQLKHYKLAASLAERGIPFSFSSVSTKPKEIKKNLRTMIENGLTEDQALAALTTNAASALGISQYAGTIEKGKMANLVISNKPYFDEKAQVKYVMIGGDLYEYEIKPEKKKKEKSGDDSADPSSLAGDWSYSVEVPGQTQTGMITIEGSEGDYSGTMISDDDPDEITLNNVSYSDGTLSFNMEIDGMSLEFNVEVDGTDFEGQVKAGDFGSFPIEGSKKGPKQ